MADWFLLALLSAPLFGGAAFLLKVGTHFYPGSNPFLLMGLYTTGTLGFLVVTLSRDGFQLTPVMLLAGVLLGCGSVFGNIMYVRALAVGPASLTSPLANTNTVLVIFMSLVVFQETLTLTETIAIVILLLAVSLLPIDPNESISIKSRQWYGLVAASVVLFFIRNGGLKITDELGLDNAMLLMVGYALGIVWFSGYLAVRRHHFQHKSWQKALVVGLAAGLFSFSGIYSYSLALELGPASIVAPIFSANSMVVAALSILLLGERLSRLQTIALIMVVIGLIVLRI